MSAEDITGICVIILAIVVFAVGCWAGHKDHLAWRERMRQRFGDDWDE